jgi:hypothetical protein
MATNLTDAAGGKPLAVDSVFDVTPAMGQPDFEAVPVAAGAAVEKFYGPIGRIAAFKAPASTPVGMFKRHVVRPPGNRIPKPHVDINSPRLTSQIRSTEKPVDLG